MGGVRGGVSVGLNAVDILRPVCLLRFNEFSGGEGAWPRGNIGEAMEGMKSVSSSSVLK